MSIVLIVILFFFILSLNGAVKRVNLRINNLEDKIDAIKIQLNKASDNKYADIKTEVKTKTEVVHESKKQFEKAAYISQPQKSQTVKTEQHHVAKPAIYANNTTTEKTNKSFFWEKIEKMFAENVTGFAGVTAVVVGIVFLAIYAAISMGPVARFAIVCGFSMLFYVMYVLLRKYSFWENLASWLRTASGAVFLVACIGASQFSYMQWIYDPFKSWILILIGLLVNISLGALSRKEFFATVHVIMSLFVLMIVPFTYFSFIVSAAICFIALLMTLGNKKWNTLVICVNISFMILNVYWLMNYFNVWPASSLMTICLCLFVALPCLISHYRKMYEGWDGKALLSHMIVWITLGINLYLHARGTIWSTIGLGVGSFLTFILSFYAKKLKAEWLYVCDRLVSLVLGILTCLSLHKFDMEYYQIAFFISIFSMVFLKLNTYTKNLSVFIINNFVVVVSYAAFFLLLIIGFDRIDTGFFVYLILSFAVCMLLFPSIERYAGKENFGFSVNENPEQTTTFLIPIFIGHILIAALFASMMKFSNYLWFLIPFAMSSYAIVFKRFYKNQIFDANIKFMSVVTSIFYMYLILFKKYDLALFAGLSAIVAVTGILNLIFSWSEKNKQNSYKHGLFILWSILMLCAYKFTITTSTMLPGILWLIIFMAANDIKDIKWKKTAPEGEKGSVAEFVTRLAEISFLAFAVRFCLVDLSNQTMLADIIPARVATEVLSLLTLLYWMVFSTKSENAYINNSKNNMLEVFLIFASFYVFAEIGILGQGISFAAMALFCLFAGPKLGGYNRLTLYGYIMFFIALANVGFIAYSAATPSIKLYDQVWFRSSITVVLTALFALYANKKITYTTGEELLACNKLSQMLKNTIIKHDTRVLVYPLFAAVAFFLYGGFDKSILSVLWMIECFILFVISIVLGNLEYRKVSMYFVAAIFVRIMFYDLQGQDFLVKALIFIIIGCILIIMNTIYNKYKYRYEK